MELADMRDLGAVTTVKVFRSPARCGHSLVKTGSPVFINADQALCSASVPRRVKTEDNKIATGLPAAHICGRGGIGRLDGFRFRYLSGVRVRVPPPAPHGADHQVGGLFFVQEYR